MRRHLKHSSGVKIAITEYGCKKTGFKNNVIITTLDDKAVGCPWPKKQKLVNIIQNKRQADKFATFLEQSARMVRTAMMGA